MAGLPVEHRELRAFLALPLAEHFSNDFERMIRGLRPKTEGIKWVQPTQVHVTLHFFGRTKPEQVEAIQKIVKPITDSYSAICLGLNGLGFFPNPHRPRVIWIGLKGDVDKLTNLQKQIEDALKQEGFPAESRPFKPHVTIGRVRRGQEARISDAGMNPKDPAAFESELARFKEAVLFKSVLGPKGPKYEILESFPFS